jgi:uncharacterized iron-regulated membrane protein
MTTIRGHGRFHRAVWRWHFYAGLLVLPFLIWLALTGSLYAFKTQIDGYFHRDLKTVPLAARPARPPGEIVDAALAAHPGTWFRYAPAAHDGASAEVGVATAAGERLSVFVDPRDARVLGHLSDQGSVAWTIRRLHSLKAFGPVARGFVELAAGWAVLLVATGLYLWWPRGRRGGGVTRVRGRPRERVFWRDLHALTGVVVGGALVFLAITGLPWSVLWGAQVNRWANGSNFGYPAGVRVQVPMSSTQRLADDAPTSWSLAQARVPRSTPPDARDEHAGHARSAEHPPFAVAHAEHAEHAGRSAPASTTATAAATAASAEAAAVGAPPGIDLATAVGIVERLGIGPGYTLTPPRGPTGVYTASVYPDDLARQRVIHLDRYSGRPLLDMRYADYGPLGRWLEWGINVHLGQEFGVPNQLALVAACLGIVGLCASGAVMWWKRRPAGARGVPPPVDRRTMLGVTALLAVGGVAFPLVGASMLVMGAVDRWVFRDA